MVPTNLPWRLRKSDRKSLAGSKRPGIGPVVFCWLGYPHPGKCSRLHITQRELPVAAGRRERTRQHVRLEILASKVATLAGKPGERLTGTGTLANLETQGSCRSLANMLVGPRVLISKSPSSSIPPEAIGDREFFLPSRGIESEGWNDAANSTAQGIPNGPLHHAGHGPVPHGRRGQGMD